MTVVTVAGEKAGFRQHLEGRGRAPSTVGNYLRMLEPLAAVLSARGVEDLRAATRQDIDAYASELGRGGRYRTQTQRTMLRAAKRFFEYLVESSKLFASPAEHLRDPRQKRLLGPVLDEAKVQKLLAAPNTGLPRGIRDRALLEVLYATGLRRKEVCELAVYDVDLDGGLLRVRHGKGRKERFVPLTAEAQRWLREYLREVRPRLARLGPGSERRLFLSAFGRGMGPEVLGQLLRKYGKQAGIEHVSCHTFRRTMATGLLRGGADLRSVGAVLGHAHLDATERYTQITPKDLRAVQARTHPRGKADGPAAR